MKLSTISPPSPSNSPFFTLNYAIFAYFLLFFLYYFQLYANVDNVYVTSAVIERSTVTQLSLVLYIDSESHPRDVFLLLDEKGRRLELEQFPLSDNPRIQMWSGEIDPSFIQEELKITAEHDKTALLADHFGRPALQLSTSESYTERHKVVSCMSPISRESNAIHVFSSIMSAISAGSFVNIPFADLDISVHSVLDTWQTRQLVRLQSHPITRQPINDVAARRDLAFAHCLLLYRRSSAFLVFQPIEEVVLPIREPTYSQEFAALFRTNEPNNLLARYNAKVVRAPANDKLPNLSPRNLLGTAKIVITDTSENPVFVLKTSSPYMEIQKVGPLYTTKLNGTEYGVSADRLQHFFDSTILNDPHYQILQNDCHVSRDDGATWKCVSSKCVRGNLRHESVQGLYNYDIHQSTFLNLDSFDCKNNR